MKKRTSKSNEHSQPLTTERLRGIWKRICSDARASRALRRLDKAGFRISHLEPRDAAFKNPSWADYIAALPLLSNKPTTRRIHRNASLRKYWPLVREIRRFAEKLNVPFVEMRIFGKRDYEPVTAISALREDLLKAASMLEHFLSWDYYERHLNRRNALIAELRWTIRKRTGKPHDRELGILIDTAFRVAGQKEGCYLGPATLDRIEKLQREGGVKANRQVRYLQ